MIQTLIEALGLKALPRAGWLRIGIREPESVAAHSWGVAWLTLVLLPEGLDLRRALIYAVLHDLPEVRVGDLTPHDRVPPGDKAAAEHRAMAALTIALPRGDALLSAWEAYEAQRDPESRFVRQLDRLDMALQAVAYRRHGPGSLEEFLDSAAMVISDPQLVELLEGLRRQLQGDDGQGGEEQGI